MTRCALKAPESPDGTGLEKTGSNFYQTGITGPEIMAVLDKTLKPNINSRVIRSDKGLACETLTTQSPGAVGAALQKVVAHLQAALPYALSAHQKDQIQAMIKYFQGGDVEDFRQASISWVRDRADSRVDFMIGWVEFLGEFAVHRRPGNRTCNRVKSICLAKSAGTAGAGV